MELHIQRSKSVLVQWSSNKQGERHKQTNADEAKSEKQDNSMMQFKKGSLQTQN